MTAPLHAFVVTLCFAGVEQNGPVHTSIVLAPSEAAAAAMVTHAFMCEQPTELPLTCCIATEVEPAYLRHLLRAVEGRLPESGNAEVLSLVPKAADIIDKNFTGGMRTEDYIALLRAGEPDPRQPVGGGPPLDAADASTFTGTNVDRLWDARMKVPPGTTPVADMPWVWPRFPKN